MRHARAADRENRLYARDPEAWLESQVRANMERIDATLLRRPIFFFGGPFYGQAPQFAAGERGILDLLAARRDGRLAVVEIKASQDIHLPCRRWTTGCG